MEYKKRFFSIECCPECAFPNQRCFSVNLATHEHNLCIHAKVREMFENWMCDKCGARLGLQDSRHRIPFSPKQELEKLRRAQEGEMVYLKTYLETKVLCDHCYNELPSTTKAREIFGLDMRAQNNIQRD